MVERGAHAVCELSDKRTNRLGSDVLLYPRDVPRMFRVIVICDCAGLTLKEDIHFPLKLVEMFICPTEFHLCIGEPDAQWHRLTSTMPKYGNSGTERSPQARSAFPRALGYPGSAPRGPTHSLRNSHTSFPPAFDAGETHAPTPPTVEL